MVDERTARRHRREIVRMCHQGLGVDELKAYWPRLMAGTPVDATGAFR